MWWKFLILFLMGVPLGHRAWQEIQAHPDEPPTSPHLLTEKALTTKQKEQTAAAKEEEDRILEEDLRDVMFRGSLHKPATVRLSRTFPELSRSVSAHLDAVNEFRSFADAFVEVEIAPDKKADCKEPYDEWLEQKKKTLKGVQEREKTLRTEASALSGQAQKALSELNPELLMQTGQKAESLIGKLEAHEKGCAGFSLLESAAKRKTAEWNAYKELLQLAYKADTVKNSKNQKAVGDYLDSHHKILKTPDLPAEVQDLTRKNALALCKAYLAEEKMAEDDWVLYYRKASDKKPTRVEKKKVQVSFYENRRPKGLDPITVFPYLEDLKKLNFDEFSPKTETDVECYYLPGNDQVEKISPTDHNRAARYYNEHRQKLLDSCNKKALSDFLSGCKVKWTSDADMPLAFQRLKAVEQAMQKMPELFPGNR